MFVYKKRVAFHETDCMGVVHHSVYAKYFEEARVEFLYHHNLDKEHAPQADYTLAVLDLNVRYKKPLKVGNEFEVHLEVQLEKETRVKFNYSIFYQGELATVGSTLHVGVNKDLKVQKVPQALKQAFVKVSKCA